MKDFRLRSEGTSVIHLESKVETASQKLMLEYVFLQGAPAGYEEFTAFPVRATPYSAFSENVIEITLRCDSSPGKATWKIASIRPILEQD